MAYFLIKHGRVVPIVRVVCRAFVTRDRGISQGLQVIGRRKVRELYV